METVIRNVAEIEAHDREALEHVLGHALRENQQLEIRIVNPQGDPEPVTAPVQHPTNGSPPLPEWCNVYDGLSDDEITALEKTILQRAELSRPSE
ncbi:MAG: hypothetical protein HY290_10280 [Planctomycetia bacterium]|nr:hypothetical protein [Planctomycetia bacterium]